MLSRWNIHFYLTDSRVKTIEDLTIFINHARAISSTNDNINLDEGAILTVVFRVFGAWSISSPECYQLRQQAKGRIHCYHKYPCNSKALGRRDPAAAFHYNFNAVKLSDSETTITFHPGHQAIPKAIKITGKKYTTKTIINQYICIIFYFLYSKCWTCCVSVLHI